MPLLPGTHLLVFFLDTLFLCALSQDNLLVNLYSGTLVYIEQVFILHVLFEITVLTEGFVYTLDT